MAQAQVAAPVWGQNLVYAGKDPGSDTNPWPMVLLNIHGMVNATGAVAAGGPGYDAAYAACLNKNDLLFAMRSINGAGGQPVGI